MGKKFSAFLIAVAIGWAGSGTSVPAATISVQPLANDRDPAHAFVLVEGVLMPDDDKLFRSRVGALTKATIGFSSDGGSLFAGIAIGKIIRLKSFATLVMSGKRCASACALAWLGGTTRYMASNAYIGFHAAYVEKEGRATETGVGNALLGSYLAQIGLSERAVFYITERSPNEELNWLSMHDAEQNGIDVKLFQGTPTAASEAPPRQPVLRVAPVEPAAPSPSQAGPILPKRIASSYTSEPPGLARMHTCLDQYKANKENGSNGGLVWIQQGGGYYTECNQHLKAMGY
jgi:hypothetical protein